MEPEYTEQPVCVNPERVVIGGGAVNSVNGQTGDVVLTTSDIENTSDYQTGAEVASAIRDEATARQNADTILQNNIDIEAGFRTANDETLEGRITAETTNRENADRALQSQIDAITASSDVTDIVGTYAQLQSYDTTSLSNNDIIKVLQDENQNNETTYYRWNASTQVFTLIGEEGPYYTKSEADSQFVPQTRTVNGKALSTNIALDPSDVGAVATTDVEQVTGTSVSKVMSQNAVTTALSSKLDASSYVVDSALSSTSENPVQNKVIYAAIGDIESILNTINSGTGV